MSTIQVDIVSAEGELFAGEVDAVYAPAVMGEIGIHPRHTPLLTTLKPGSVRILENGDETDFYVSGGVMEVQPGVVTILSDTAERGADIDEVAAADAKKRAEEALSQAASETDLAMAQAELAEAAARLHLVQKLKSKR